MESADTVDRSTIHFSHLLLQDYRNFGIRQELFVLILLNLYEMYKTTKNKAHGLLMDNLPLYGLLEDFFM